MKIAIPKAIFHWSVCAKSGKSAVMYVGRGIDC